MGIKLINLIDLSIDQLKEYLCEQGEPASQAERVFKYLYRDLATGFEEMAGLPLSLRQKLSAGSSITALTSLAEKVSSDGQTRKWLFRLDDGRTIESALMFFGKSSGSFNLRTDSAKDAEGIGVASGGRKARERCTVCVSTQVGCPVGCGFCATGQQGFERNLRPGEIVEQVLFSLRWIRASLPEGVKKPTRELITNVVFMGMGEPLANYENVRQAVKLLQSPQGLGLGIRQITLSTVGLVPQIRRLIEDNLQIELAVSLHAATDEVRDRLVPINQKYPLESLMAACQEYSRQTGRRVFIEYAIFSGINDSLIDAGGLVRLLDNLPCSVNLIVGNRGFSQEYQPAPLDRVLAFQKKLVENGIRCMVRVSKGADIEAGCGQLRSRYLSG